MHHLLDEGIIELKKSSDTNKSGSIINETNDQSYSLRNQLNKDYDSRSNSREYKRPPHVSHPERYPHKQMNNNNLNYQKQIMNNDSSLRMFLEELKNEEISGISNKQYLQNTFSNNQEKQHQHHNHHDDSIQLQQNYYNNNTTTTYNSKQEILQNQNINNKHQFSPQMMSSLASSANIEMLKIQEESFSKIHNDIASLQNKIKGLENKLGSKQSQNQNSNNQNMNGNRPIIDYQTNKNQNQPVFQEKQDYSNRQKLQQENNSFINQREYDENEDRIRKYKNSTQQSSQQKYNSSRHQQPISETSQLNIRNDGSDRFSIATGKENKQQSLKGVVNQSKDTELSSDSDNQSYQTFPLRLKKQFVQQQQEINNQRAQLNERYNQPRQITEPINERYEAINDSNDGKYKKQQNHGSNNSKVVYSQKNPRSLTETDQLSNSDESYIEDTVQQNPVIYDNLNNNSSSNMQNEQEYIEDEEQSYQDCGNDDATNQSRTNFKYQNHNDISGDLNDSTISVNEKMKQRIKQKMQEYKDQNRSKNDHRQERNQQNQHRRSTQRSSSRKSLSTSLKRSNTQEITKHDKENGSRVRRQVRFSETKKQQKSRRNSQHSQSQSNNYPQVETSKIQQQDMLELKRQNSNLRLELETLHKKYEVRDEYYNKYRDLKVKYKSLQDGYKALDLKKREQKEVIDEQKLMIAKLKKKLKTQKEKVKKLKGESPERGQNAKTTNIITKSVSKSYKTFKTEDNSSTTNNNINNASTHKRQKSQKKLQPSDIHTRNKSKTIKMMKRL